MGRKGVESAWVLGDEGRISGPSGWLGLVLCNVGEFSFVVIDFATEHSQCSVVVIVAFLDLSILLKFFSFYKGRTDGP